MASLLYWPIPTAISNFSLSVASLQMHDAIQVLLYSFERLAMSPYSSRSCRMSFVVVMGDSDTKILDSSIPKQNRDSIV